MKSLKREPRNFLNLRRPKGQKRLNSRSILFSVLAAIIYLGLESPLFGSEISASSQEAPKEDLGYDIQDGQTNRIARIVKVTPMSVWVVYENGYAGRKILREELPLQLQAKYPYEPAKIAEYQNLQAAKAEGERIAQREGARLREQLLMTQIAGLQRQNVEDQKERNILFYLTNGGRTPGNGRLLRLAQLRNKQQEIEMRILALKSQVEQLHAQSD